MSRKPIQVLFSSRVKFGRALCFILIALLCAGSLTACGKRPNQVDPPPGVSKNVYTRQYPDISTDGQE